MLQDESIQHAPRKVHVALCESQEKHSITKSKKDYCPSGYPNREDIMNTGGL